MRDRLEEDGIDEEIGVMEGDLLMVNSNPQRATHEFNILALKRSASPSRMPRSFTTAIARSRFASSHPPLVVGNSARPRAKASMSLSSANGKFGG